MRESVKFYIPGFAQQDKFIFNTMFIDYMKENPDKFRNCEIQSIFDCFTPMIWNGGRSIRNEMFSLDDCKTIINTINEKGISVRFTCTNSLIEQKHLNEYFSNTILEYANESKINDVLVYSDILEEYIRDKYPNLRICYSTTKCDSSIDSINKVIESKKYLSIVPDFNLNNTDELFSIEDKSNIELLINESCCPGCQDRAMHYKMYSSNNIKYGKNIFTEDNIAGECDHTEYKSCDLLELINKNNKAISVDDLYSKYYDAGFRNFKIAGRDFTISRNLVAYVYYMVKPEYQLEVISHFLQIFC